MLGDILGGTCQVVSGLPKDRDDDAITWMFLRDVGTGIRDPLLQDVGRPRPEGWGARSAAVPVAAGSTMEKRNVPLPACFDAYNAVSARFISRSKELFLFEKAMPTLAPIFAVVPVDSR